MLNKILSIFACSVFAFSACSKSPNQPQQPMPDVVHTSKLAPGWYPQEPKQLTQELDSYLGQVDQNFKATINGKIKAIIAPHAGYYYSGLCAATAYQTLLEQNQTGTPEKNKTISRVIVLAPSHTTFYNGVALPDYTIYQTALGPISVDTDALRKLKKSYAFRVYGPAHAQEHALELQLPFLQKTINNFSLIPLVVGHLSPEDCFEVATKLKTIIDDATLIVVSSDFVHHGNSYDYKIFDTSILAHVRAIDAMATQALAQKSLDAFEQMLEQTGATICGREPLRVLLMLLALSGSEDITTHLTCYYTSAHTKNARINRTILDQKKLLIDVPDTQAENSVSYVGMVLTENKPSEEQGTPPSSPLLTGYEQKALIQLARATLENAFKDDAQKTPEYLLCPIVSNGLCTPCGAFVTLNTKDGQLRGCIGRIMTTDPLFKTVHDMTQAAAFHDSRFTPVEADELSKIVIEISVLTKPEMVANYNDIVLGKHGIILNKRGENESITHSAVFLAHVPTEFRWTLETTLEQLSLKAGLERDAWKRECDFEVFEEIVIRE